MPNCERIEKKICFVSRYLHHLLMGTSSQVIGGAEFQQYIIAQKLAATGWKVVIVTEAFREKSIVLSNGIEILPCLSYLHNGVLPRRLLLYWQLWRGLSEANSDIYYQRNPGIFSGLIGIFCRFQRRKYVVSGASDSNFDKGNELNINSFFDRIELTYGLKLANTIMVQNNSQSELLKSNYGLNSIVFNNIYDDAQVNNITNTDIQKKNKNKTIAWVGRLVSYKQPHLFIELARLLPDYDFILVGAKSKNDSFDVDSLIENECNVDYLGHLSIDEVEEVFDSVDALVNTSLVEGFPNTFLQAWSRGIPVFSFLDPGSFISLHGLGEQADNIGEIALGISRYFENDTFHKSSHIKLCFEKNFSAQNRIGEFKEILLSS